MSLSNVVGGTLLFAATCYGVYTFFSEYTIVKREKPAPAPTPTIAPGAAPAAS